MSTHDPPTINRPGYGGRTGDAVSDRPGQPMHAMIELAPLGIAFVDRELRFVQMNAVLRATVPRPDEIVGRTVAEVLPERWKQLEPICRRVLGGATETLDFEAASGAGPRAWSTTYFPVIVDGVVTGFGIVASDVTELRGSEAALEIRTTLYAMLAQAYEAVSSARTRVELFARICEIAVATGGFLVAWIGVPEGDDVHRVASAGLARDYLATLAISLDPDSPLGQGPTGEALRSGAHVVVNDFATATSTAPWHEAARRAGIESSAAFPIEEHGVAIGVLTLYSGVRDFFTDERVGTLSDVLPGLTLALERFAAERDAERQRHVLEEREHAARQLAAIVESSDDAIIGKTLDGIITSWNAGAAAMYGYRADEVVGRPIGIIVPPERQDELAKMMDQVRLGARIGHRNTVRVTKDDRLLDVSVTLSPVFDAHGALVGVSAIGKDITEHVRREREQKQLDFRLGEIERLESLGQLAGGIAHDFNNLLGAIANYARFVEDELHDEVAARADLAQIRTAAERAADLTRQLLTFARRETQQPRVLDVNAVTTEVQHLLEQTSGEHVALETALAPGLWSVEADPGHLEQILINLVLNARDAMPGGGSITIDTANFFVDASDAGARFGLPPGRYVRLRVSDAGEGMAASVRARAFEPFFTTKAAGEGTGLGLATVFGIVKRAGGDVQLYSEPGLGTTVQVLLPATDEEAADTAAPSGDTGGGGNETVLLVDDEPAIREVARRILARHGYEVVPCANGEEALAHAVLPGVHFDLLLTDVVMPHMLGNEVATRLRALHPELRVLFMSGYAQPVFGSVLADDVDILDKPFTEQQLLDKVRLILDR